MTGILSLIDPLLGIPLPEIVEQISLTDEVKLALLSREGSLGRLLTLLEKKEGNDINAISVLLAEMAFLGFGELTTAELDAVRWANGLNEARH